MKTKICILQNGLARGGTDTFVVNLCKELDKNKFEITVVNPSDNPIALVREPEILATGATIVHTSPLTSIKSKICHFYRLYKFFKKNKIDIFQTNIDLFNGPNLMVAWLAGVPIRCCHSHNSMQLKELAKGRKLFIRLYQYGMRWMCWHFSNRRVGCSELANDFLYKNRPWRKAPYPTIIKNGIDIVKFKNLTGKEEKKKELKLTAKYHIVTVGHFNLQKNPLFIAHSFLKLCERRTDVNLVWIGSGPLEEECKAIINQSNYASRVHFLGERNDVNEILQLCDMFYFPSNFEGLGIVLIEAQAAHLPCLASNVVPQEADCGGITYLSLNESIEKWVTTMINTVENRQHFSINETKLQAFSITFMVNQMEQVFENY